MKRHVLVYLGITRVILSRVWSKAVYKLGVTLRNLGSTLLRFGVCEDGWKHTLFLRCYCVDIEVHFFDGTSYRGPLYALYPSPVRKRVLIAKLNWIARKQILKNEWVYAGATDLVLPGYRSLAMLPHGDAWFSFDGGHAVIYLGVPQSRLRFLGNEDITRIYTYY